MKPVGNNHHKFTSVKLTEPISNTFIILKNVMPRNHKDLWKARQLLHDNFGMIVSKS
nr:MAG TPA: hypothetical protein [Bacteriophage sp.]